MTPTPPTPSAAPRSGPTGYVLDPRDATAHLAELRRIARRAPFPGGGADGALRTWADVLFADDGAASAVASAAAAGGPGDAAGGPGDAVALADPAAPDQALLAAFADLTAGLSVHAGTLPARMLRSWLEDVLVIPRLPAAPDSVIAVATVDPARAPAVIPKGAPLRGGKDSLGTERRYATVEALTAHGSRLIALRAHEVHRAPTVGSTPGALRDGAHAVTGPIDPAAPFTPFAPAPPTGANSTGAGPTRPAPRHAWRLSDGVLAFRGGSMDVRIALIDGDARHLAGLEWWHSTSAGPRLALQVGTPTSGGITIRLAEECVPGPDDPDGAPPAAPASTAPPAATSLPWLEARLPADRTVLPAAPLGVTFTDVSLAVVARTGVAADAATYNDGVLDISKEFQPFGPVARRGDAFYVRSDEAFAKPVTSVSITLQLMTAATGTLKPVAWGQAIPSYYTTAYSSALAGLSSYTTEVSNTEDYVHLIDVLVALAGASTAPRIVWQRRTSAGWEEFARTAGALTSVTASSIPPVPGVTGPTDEPDAAVPGAFTASGGPAGLPGRYVRAFLAEGDFGWLDYQRRIGQFAAEAAKKTGGNPDPDDLIPPDPPIVSTLSLSYTTHPVRPARVTARDGWAERTWDRAGSGAAPWAPFVVPDAPGPTTAPGGTAVGSLAVGLEIPTASLGSAVALYLDVASAAACGGADVPAPRWEVWAGSAWAPLDVADGTRGLRQSGILRFVAPAGWPIGCAGAGAPSGRWLRLLTAAPGAIGTLRGVVPDAVEAAYVSRQADPATDPTPAAPLAPGEIKGLLTPVPGVKKVSNVASVRGRGPESDAAYARRAGGTTRHRGRAAQPWDYENLTLTAFPEVVAARCLPHTGADGAARAGSVGLVVLPSGTEDAPVPTVSLAGRIRDHLTPLMPLTAHVAVLCPLYVLVRVEADVRLTRGVPALDGRNAITSALRAWLHPTSTLPPPFGREVFASVVVAFLEGLPEVDRVTAFALVGPAGPAPSVAVDPCRGLVASGDHRIVVTEQIS